MRVRPNNDSKAAFTLIELLVVIAIMGLLLGIGIPAIKGMTKSNAMAAADRQMLDDLAYARQRAIAGHTTVYVAFISPNILNLSTNDPIIGPSIARLYSSQFTTYAMLSMRSVGEQPGRSNPKYLTSWRPLPQGIFIATNKFGTWYPNDPDAYRCFSTNTPITGSLSSTFPFPYVTNTAVPAMLPYIGFDYLGRLVSQKDEYIPLVQGSLFYLLNPGGSVQAQIPDVQEKPPGNSIYSTTGYFGPGSPQNYYPGVANQPGAFNQIHIDWLTGRARIEKAEIQ